MIRRDTWSAVYVDVEAELKQRLPALVKGATHRWGALRWPADAVPPTGYRPESAVYASEDDGEIRHMLVMLTARTTAPARVGAAYPFVPHGTAYDVEIRALHPHESGIEGEVTARYGDTEFRFFEPLWGIRRTRYRPGTVQRVRFAAFGHALEAMNLPPVVNGTTANLARPPAAIPDLPSVMIPIGPGPSSRYGIHAPITEWRGFWIGERLYYALKLRLAGEGDRAFAVDLYAGRHCFETNFSPAPGIALAGVLWLHGTLAV